MTYELRVNTNEPPASCRRTSARPSKTAQPATAGSADLLFNPEGVVLFALLLLLIAPGCAAFPLFGKTVKIERASAQNPAVEILALWQASEGPGPTGVPTRGFSGQIFFTQGKPSPVVVDGKVRIYLFDDRGTVQQQAKPIGEYDFDPVNWNSRAHSSTLGPGYAVFIPYPRNDFHQATCSLRLRFIPNKGPTIYSPTASVVLTGPPTKAVAADEKMFQSPQPRQTRVPSPDFGELSRAVPGVQGQNNPGAGRRVTPVSGTEDDARLSLADDVAAPDENNVRSGGQPLEATASRPRSFKLQSSTAEASEPEEN